MKPLDRLAEKLGHLGWKAAVTEFELVAKKVAIVSKWPLGKCQIEQRLHLVLDPSMRVLKVAEAAKETTVGLPPPVFSWTQSRQRGMAVMEDRIDGGMGGGSLDYGKARELAEQECEQMGWTLQQCHFM